ncbi:T7SS effector LXG polymorphic toxin [Bacillus pumilus]|uniref:T7SS effector LXG polymorphic toxin n=1 Tax=Bacillus pumilus TaxID=1408 RepID=UPI0029C1FA35|nr:T7SS effector LXG polymorphic toxin [Bacillus pumilus]MDX5484599.1 T7SS effector LXG polymorphic toxin [Bacillus pumilus]
MKTLDAFALINGMDQTLNTLKQQSQQISSIEKQIHQIISLDGALKGEAGQAIRSFYTECHIPFLQFFQVVIEEYSTALKSTKQALHALEPNQHGLISQSFIEHELDQGLKKAERTISEIVTDVNHAIGRIGHIVHLPNVDESAFQQSYQKAWLETSRTIGLLHAFDREQTSALQETKSSLQTMKQFINTLSTMFTGPKIDITTYQKGSIFKNGKEEKISSTVGGLNDKIDNPKDNNPMMIMLKKLREKEQTDVETVVRDDTHKYINKQVTVNDLSLTTLQREAVNGKNKIHRDIRVINGKLYNVKGIKKLKEFDIADEVVTDSSDIDFIGGRYTVYANKQIIRTYIANGEVRIEEVDKIPESRSRGNAKRILDGEVVSTTENIILEYSGIYDGYRAVTGKDPETSQNISRTEQALSAASIIPFMKIIKGGKYVFKIDQGEKVVKKVEKPTSVTGQVGWSLSKGGGIINQRKYSQHALERMAPNIPEVRATLTRRALKKADELGYQPQTKDFNDFIKKYVDPRDIPPSVIEDAIKNTNKIPGHRKGTFVHDTQDVRVVINEFGDVITVIPK